MKFDLSGKMINVEGLNMSRRDLQEKYSDQPLTLGFVIAHVLAVAAEDIQAVDKAASEHDAKAASLDQVNGEVFRKTAKDMRSMAFTEKLRRGDLSMYISRSDLSAVELTTEDCQLIMAVVPPRLLPLMLAQLVKVIN